MTIRENIMAVYNHEKPERIPWLTFDIPYPMLPRGAWERELRNKGLGVAVVMAFHSAGNIYTTEMKNVEVEQRPEEKGGKSILTTTYHTPVGSISKKELIGISPPNPWILEFPIKSISDYKVAEFIFQTTVYQPNYEKYLWADKHLGSDGYVLVQTGYSPFQNLLIKHLGFEGLFTHIYDHTAEFEHLFEVLKKNYMEIVRIIADSPAEVVGIDGNISGIVTSPKLFELYVMPVYQKASEILHAKNKIVQVHFDGSLKPYKDLIPETGIDVIEAFTPPPVGDLSISEARLAWGENIIIEANFPESIFLQGVEATKKFTLDILKEVAPGDGFILSITEDIPYQPPHDLLEESLRAVTEVMWEYGKYPVRL
jgi:hypothetical protein